DILQGRIAPEQVHVMISIPPHVTISRLIQRTKGKSSYRLLAEFPHMRKRFWGRHVWARGTSVAAAATSPTRSSMPILRSSPITVITYFGSRERRPVRGHPVKGVLGRGAARSTLARLSGYKSGLSRHLKLPPLGGGAFASQLEIDKFPHTHDRLSRPKLSQA